MIPLQKAAREFTRMWASREFTDPNLVSQMRDLRKALEAEQAQAVEPVAWRKKRPDGGWALLYQNVGWKDLSGFEPLFTHPAPPLEYDQQAMELCEECGWKAIIPGEPCLNCGRGEVMKALDAYAAERDALMADAARYQFIKSYSRVAGLDIGEWHRWTYQIRRSDIKGATLDEAIDSAIKKAGIETKTDWSAA